MIRFLVTAFLLCFGWLAASSQHSLLYEVSGNGLKKPSYLFGTFHLFGQSFVDSQTVVMQKLKSTKAVAGEVVTDSIAIVSNTMLTALLTDTPLDKLLSPQAYVELNAWFYDLMGMDLTFYKNMPPALVNAMLVQLVYAKNFKHDKDFKAMDMYIQDYARKKKKKVYGLETVQVQMDALFGRSLKRQAQQLEEFVQEKDSIVPQLQLMLSHYRNANYDELIKLMYNDEGFTKEETDLLLNNRNKAWLDKLPTMMNKQSTFVSVGAMHLAGENGLVEGLRKRGYTVTPLPLKKKS
jgi:uncharacterized protein